MRLWFRQNLIYLIFIALITLGVHYELFLGANFFTEEDPVTLYHHIHGNAEGNGWRPDKGLGMSFFWGDPGAFHAWSVFTFWERLFSDGEMAYNASTMILMIFAAFSQYYFLRLITPKLSPVICALLAPIIILGPMRHELFFQRHWLTLSICMPIFLKILHNYVHNPKAIHLFQGGALLWFSLFFGSFAPFQGILVLGVLFVITHCAFHKSFPVRLALQTVLFYIFGIGCVVLLGSWVFYSMFLESQHFQYVRSPIQEISWTIEIERALRFTLNTIFSSWMPFEAQLSDRGLLPKVFWTNVTPVVPLIFIMFLFRRSKQYWEFIIKWMLIALISHQALISVIPAYQSFLNMIINNYPMHKFQPAYHMLQIGLIAVFLQHLQEIRTIKVYKAGVVVQQIISIILATFFMGLTFFAVVAFLAPSAWPSLVKGLFADFGPKQFMSMPLDILVQLASENVLRMQNATHWYSLGYFLVSGILCCLFFRVGWITKHFGSSKAVKLAGLIFISSLGLAWHAFPLNKKALVWEQSYAQLPKFPPTARFFEYTQPASSYLSKLREDGQIELYNHYFERWWKGKYGPREYFTGYLMTPGLNLSGIVSFWDKKMSDALFQRLNQNEIRLPSLRHLSGGTAIHDPIFDVAAVSHYYSTRKIYPIPNEFQLEYEGKQLFVYRNQTAWPYYYLAKSLDISTNGQLPEKPIPGTAYVKPTDAYNISQKSSLSQIELKEFTYGKLTFNFNSEKDEFLVIADGWHPFWKAKSNLEKLKVVRANQLFKGIHLPKGNYEFELYFDTYPYNHGIYISLLAWIVFISTFFLAKHYDIRFDDPR